MQGGHVSPYIDPQTGDYFDMGVQTFLDYGPARAFFARLNVPTGEWAPVRYPITHADFITGNSVSFTAPAFVPAVQSAAQVFLDVITPFESFYTPGFFNFPAPRDIPADLLLPFGDFVKKHQLEAAVTTIFRSTGLGMGDLLNSTTLYVLTTFGGPMMRSFFGTPNFAPATGRNQDLYNKVTERLSADVLYNSVVTQTTRSARGKVTLLVTNADRTETTRIIADKLLISVEPTQENIRPFALDRQEREILGKLKYTNEYVGLVTHPSLPSERSILHTLEAAAPNNTLALPSGNFFKGFEYHGSAGSKPLWRTVIVGQQSFTASEARALVHTQFKRLQASGLIAQSDVELEFAGFTEHGAMHMHADAEELKRGFIQRMYSLQGRKNTWWTGGAWSSGFQSILWAFDDVLLEKMFGVTA